MWPKGNVAQCSHAWRCTLQAVEHLIKQLIKWIICRITWRHSRCVVCADMCSWMCSTRMPRASTTRTYRHFFETDPVNLCIMYSHGGHLQKTPPRRTSHNWTTVNSGSLASTPITSNDKVSLEERDGMPACECYDWVRYHWPCKHMLAMFQHGVKTWHDLCPAYRDSLFFSLDAGQAVRRGIVADACDQRRQWPYKWRWTGRRHRIMWWQWPTAIWRPVCVHCSSALPGTSALAGGCYLHLQWQGCAAQWRIEAVCHDTAFLQSGCLSVCKTVIQSPTMSENHPELAEFS